jgi:CRISPR/Cas system CMR-associated protein Cmr1 (group 7 of RAMP superfamily)
MRFKSAKSPLRFVRTGFLPRKDFRCNFHYCNFHFSNFRGFSGKPAACASHSAKPETGNVQHRAAIGDTGFLD